MNKTLTLACAVLLGTATTGHAQMASRSAVPTSASEATPAAPAVLTFADEMPVFPGGDAAMHQYLAKKIVYPEAATQQNLSGTVYVRFVVDEQGRVRDAEVAKGCGHGFDEEALRVVRLMPWWTPGRMAGQPVRVQRTLPIIFRLSK
ncbi:energy transducer TonB [Hymenobacter properus]|uniref:Energy transducer TonB n=1 Tax=Hymenobacter properus TaxID=2791026 RepID=A0A931BIZ3_9BACT|nr:energy transducer TonB [Hymenobacter properus]MBF9143168.1 energy transducer TonB [Hymenobacter properus]MBR7721976.1 energy transducer TonB [Microvirga sp. SRT04]